MFPEDQSPATSTEIAPLPSGEQGLEQAVVETARATEQELASEKVVIAAPLSFAGSASRIWKLTKLSAETPYRIALGVCAVFLIVLAWTFVLAWYLIFGLLLVPYRLIRRGQRKRKREALMHRETLSAIQHRRDAP